MKIMGLICGAAVLSFLVGSFAWAKGTFFLGVLHAAVVRLSMSRMIFVSICGWVLDPAKVLYAGI